MAEDEGAADRLPDDAVVVRGGYMSFTNFEASTYNHYVETGYVEYALSVFCLPGCDGDEICRRCTALRHGKYKESTVGEIRTAGYDVMRNEPPLGHALVTSLPSPPSREDWQRLKAVFSKEKDNPADE